MTSRVTTPAPLIAIVGCDGSGKSTVSEAVLALAKQFGPAEAAHLGKQSGNVGRALAQWPVIGPWIDRRIVEKTDATRSKRQDKKSPGLLAALVICLFLLRRMLRFRRMLGLRKQGRIIIADRFPQLDVPGASDSTDLPAMNAGNPLIRGLARLERRAFEWMTRTRPDLVIRLQVDLDTACARKPDHRRELLAEKIAVIPLLRFNGARIVDIDSNQPLEDVLTAARSAVSQTLNELGYRHLDGQVSAP